MPLDQLARRYADEMYNTRLEEIVRTQQDKKAENRAKHVSRGLAISGSVVAQDARIQVETIKLLAEARVETLVKAYERAGLPFDDTALSEISQELTQFCETQKTHAAAAVVQSVNQTFGGQANMISSVKAQIESDIHSTVAKITRELRIRRYEVVLDERKATRVYAAGLGNNGMSSSRMPAKIKMTLCDHLPRPWVGAALKYGLTRPR
jgi:hypothetical protein